MNKDKREYIIENLALMGRSLVSMLRVVNNLQTMINHDDTITDVNSVGTENVLEGIVVDRKVIMNRLVKDYFTNKLINGAKGYIGISSNLLHYNNDINSLDLETTVSYPNGFYSNQDNKSLQFLLKLDDDKGFLFIDDLDDEGLEFHLINEAHGQENGNKYTIRLMTYNELDGLENSLFRKELDKLFSDCLSIHVGSKRTS